MAKIAAFLDFQGTLGGTGTDNIKTMNFYPFAIEAIQKLNAHGILVIGITNQSQISHGILTMEEYEVKLQQLKSELSEYDAHFDAVYCCPHRKKDNCSCKKPQVGMINSARKDFDIDIENSYIVGDMGKNDMVLAKNANMNGILVLTDVGKVSLNEHRNTWSDINPDFIASNVLDAAHYIISMACTE